MMSAGPLFAFSSNSWDVFTISACMCERLAASSIFTVKNRSLTATSILVLACLGIGNMSGLSFLAELRGRNFEGNRFRTEKQ